MNPAWPVLFSMPTTALSESGLPDQRTALEAFQKEVFRVVRFGTTSHDWSASLEFFGKSCTANTPIVIETDMDSTTVLYHSNPSWALWAIDTFELDAPLWDSADISSCGLSGDAFLGGHCKFGGKTVTRRHTLLPAHERLKVTARLHFLDEWEGESLFIRVDGSLVWAQSHHWCREI
eukprot:Polyplicarium_translucidae@DN2525_c0_g2_i1.p1